MKLIEVDHRRAPRKLLRDAISASLTIGGRKFESTVLDYTLHGVSVRVEKDAMKRAERENFEIELAVEDQDTRYQGQVRHSRLDKNRAVLGIHFMGIHQDDEVVSFLSDGPDWDLVEDPETLSNILADLAFKGDDTPIAYRSFGAKATLVPCSIKDERFLVTDLKDSARGIVKPGRGSFRFELFQTCHAFEASVVAADSKTVTIELPTKVARLLRRETVRIQNEQSGVSLKIKLKSSFLGDSPEEVEVFDFSEHGIAVLDSTGWIYGPKGARFDSIEVETPSGEKIRGTGVISSYRWIPEKSAYAVGIQFSTASDGDRNRWHNAILTGRYPSFSFNYADSDHPQIWELFERSGFLNLKPRESFNLVFDVTKKTWTNLSAAGAKIEKRVLIRQDNVIVGHMQLDRIYPGTWCAHSLAIDPKVSKVVGKEIYSITTDVLSSEGASYLISITNSHKPWNQRNYYDFIKTYRFPEHNELKLFQLHEADIVSGWDLATSNNIKVRAANHFDHQRIVRYFEVYGTDLERNALALTREDLEMRALDNELKPFGLSRRREFLVGYSGSKFVGFAALESGSTGISIFGVQDTLYVYVLPEIQDESHEIFDTILNAALLRYKELGIRTVNVYVPFLRREYYTERGLKFFMEGARWISKCVAAKRYHAFTQMLYGHLILYREQIRSRHQKD